MIIADRSVTVRLIASIADFERGMAAATAATKKFEAELDGLRRAASVDLAHVGETADDVGRDMDQMAASSMLAGHQLDDLGDEAVGAAAKLGVLGHELDSVDRKMNSLGGAGMKAGGAAAGGLLSSFGDVASGMRGAMIPIAAVVVAGMAPAIAAGIGTAVVGAAGAGGIVGGIVLASKSPEVKAAWGSLGNEMLADLTQSAQGFVEPLVAAAHEVGDEWDATLGDSMTRTFDKLSESLGPLTQGVRGFMAEIGPGVEALSRAAEPVLNAFSESLPGFAASITDFSESLEAAGPDLAVFTSDLMDATGALIEFTGEFVRIGSAIYSTFSLNKLAEGVRLVRDNMLSGKNEAVGYFMEIDRGTRAQADAMGITARANQDMYASMNNLTVSFQNAAAAVGGLKTAFDQLNGPAIAFAQAEINVEEALDNMKAALDDSNGSLNVHTEKGRAARQAVLNFAEASAVAMQAKINETESVDDAIAKYNEYRGDLIKTLRQAGLTKGEAVALANAWLKMPKNVETKVKQTGAEKAAAAVQNLINKINGLFNKTVTITQRTIYTSGGAIASAFAEGTPSAPPGLAWVGERGPELMSFAGGERVFPHGQSMSIARGYAGGTGGSFGGTTRVILDVRADSEAQAAAIRKQVLILGGGNVQLAYGRGSF